MNNIMRIKKIVGKFCCSDQLPVLGFVLASLVAVYSLGAVSVRYNLFPYPQVIQIAKDVRLALSSQPDRLAWRYYQYQTPLETQTIKYAPTK